VKISRLVFSLQIVGKAPSPSYVAHPSHVLKASYSMHKLLNCTVPGAIAAISSAANISGTITVISAATNMRVEGLWSSNQSA
jgi:NAD/NADP transhydrogenase alpha subunit